MIWFQICKKFVNLLDLWCAIIFGDAVCETNKRGETVLRKPEKLSDEGDLREIRAHILSISKRLLKKNNFFTSRDFVELRVKRCSPGKADNLKWPTRW